MGVWWFIDFYRSTVFWYGQLLISVLDINTHKVNTATLRQHCVSDVFQLLGGLSGFAFTVHTLMTEGLPYSPLLGPWNRLSVGRQRISSDKHPGILAAIWLPVIPAVSWVCCRCCCFQSRCWQIARWMHSSWVWRFPKCNQSTRPSRSSPNGVPNASSPGQNKGEMKDSHLSRQMRK